MARQHEERRLITILAADVVGYSRLMAADEAGTFARLKADRKELIEPKAAEYHGRVVKLTGDGPVARKVSRGGALRHSGMVSAPVPKRTGAFRSSRLSRKALWSCRVSPLS